MQSLDQLILPAIIVSLVFVFLIVFFVYLVYKYNQNMIRKNNEMFKAVIEAGEREKLELSRNLHDQVIPLLAISKLQVESFESSTTEDNDSFKSELTDILAKSITELRGICHNSSPMLFKELGLKKSLANFFKQLALAGNTPAIHFEFNDRIRMAHDSELSIYRIILELVNNSLKYADARNIAITMEMSPRNEVLVNYRDDGRGTDLLKPGHGLLSIKSRVTLLEGEVNYHSKQHEGFNARIKLSSKLLV